MPKPISGLEGQKFNRLLVLSLIEKNEKGQRVWLCLCDCGKQTAASATRLIHGEVKSCGCYKYEGSQKRVLNLVGNRYGRLFVLRRDTSKTKVWWDCLCDCGQQTSVVRNSLVKGLTRSCGCLRIQALREHRRPIIHGSGLLILFRQYQQSARVRKIEFVLSLEEFEKLTLFDCHYCGSAPSKVSAARYSKKNPHTWNGIDRKDNSSAYILENCVPCCTTCNRAKSVLGYDEFISWIKRAAQHLSQ